MKLNKSPGPDGLTTEFYLDFWPEIGPKLVRMLNYAKTHGELPISQRRAIITLLHKQGKDELLIKNWRPISLLCVDFKILTKSLAMRVRDILPKLIHENQSGFVKNRYIGQGIRLVEDIIVYTDKNDKVGAIVQLDFEKAFDSVSWQ